MILTSILKHSLITTDIGHVCTKIRKCRLHTEHKNGMGLCHSRLLLWWRQVMASVTCLQNISLGVHKLRSARMSACARVPATDTGNGTAAIQVLWSWRGMVRVCVREGLLTLSKEMHVRVCSPQHHSCCRHDAMLP